MKNKKTKLKSESCYSLPILPLKAETVKKKLDVNFVLVGQVSEIKKNESNYINQENELKTLRLKHNPDELLKTYELKPETTVIDSFKKDRKNFVLDELSEDKVLSLEKEKKLKQIYAKVYAKNKLFKPRPWYQGILDTIFSTVVWKTIALSLIIGVFLFYFQGFQPAVLQSYYLNAASQSNALEVDLNNKTTTVLSDMESQILQKFTYNPNQVCTETDFFEYPLEELDQLRRARVGLFPSQNDNQVEKVGGFWESKIQQIYQNLHRSYFDSFVKVQDFSNQLLEIPRLLNYRNSWVELCQEVQLQVEFDSEIISACEVFVEKSNQFLEETENKNILKSEITDPIQAITEGCNNVSSQDYKEFQTSFFLQYDLFLSYVPNFETEKSEIIDELENFSNKKEESLKQMQDVYLEKRQFFNLWYLLNFDL